MALRGRNRQRQSAGLATTNAAPIITPPVPSPFRRPTMAPQMTQPYDDAIMRQARNLQPSMVGGLLPDEQAANPMGMQDETSLLPQSNGFGGLLGNSFTDPQTFGVLGGAAAMLERAGPQVSKPVSTGQVIGAGLTGFLDQFNARDRAEKLATASKKSLVARGPVVRKGTNEYMGEGVFNPETGQMMLTQPDGTLIPMPADAEPSTKNALSIEKLSGPQMVKLAGDLRSSENTLNKLTTYLQTQGGTNQGFRRMGDELIANLKTFFGTNNLTPEQLNQLIVKGQSQAILGGMRVATVGPGVMTEQDAARVLAAIGGNPDALQNPQVMGQLIQNAFEYQYNLYEQQYNDLDAAYGFVGRAMPDKILNPFSVTGTLNSPAGDVGFEIVE